MKIKIIILALLSFLFILSSFAVDLPKRGDILTLEVIECVIGNEKGNTYNKGILRIKHYSIKRRVIRVITYVDRYVIHIKLKTSDIRELKFIIWKNHYLVIPKGLVGTITIKRY